MQFFKNIDICTNCVLQEEKIDAIYSLDMDIIFSFMTAQWQTLRCHPAIKSGDCSRKKKKKKKKKDYTVNTTSGVRKHLHVQYTDTKLAKNSE